MGEVVNLRLARKAKTRDAAETQASANRAASGRTAAEKATERADALRQKSLLDGAKREPRD